MLGEILCFFGFHSWFTWRLESGQPYRGCTRCVALEELVPDYSKVMICHDRIIHQASAKWERLV